MLHGRSWCLVAVPTVIALMLAMLVPIAPVPVWAGTVGGDCAADAARRVEVSDAGELAAALAEARPGDLILLADGTYEGTFVAEASGTAEERIWLCGTREAVIDGDDFEDGYAFHLTGDYWTIRLRGTLHDGRAEPFGGM